MSRHFIRFWLVFAAALGAIGGANSQTLTSLNGTVLTGAAPTGFASQPFEYFCTSGQALCWPQIQLWDGTTQATINASDHGLNTHIVGGSIANTSFGISGTLPAFAAPPTIANTSFGISGTLPAFASPPSVTQAAGSVALGAYLAGAMADGAIVTLGAETDAPWSGTGSGTAIAIFKKIAMTAGASNASVGTNGSATPTSSTAMGFSDGTDLQQVSPTHPMPVDGGAIQSGASVPINISTATTTQLVALSGSTQIFVTSFDVVAGGTGSITLEYGTGTNCGTGTQALTGAYPLSAQAGTSKGSGLGPILFVPSGNALCALTSAAVQMSGSLSYNQQ